MRKFSNIPTIENIHSTYSILMTEKIHSSIMLYSI